MDNELNTDPSLDSASSSELTFAAAPTETSDPVIAPQAPRVVRGKLDRFGVAMGTGRRKTSVARVRIKSGSGAISINGRSLDSFFCIEKDRLAILNPLKATEKFGHVDVTIRVTGGGTTGQAGAIVMGIARALEAFNPNLFPVLKEGGFLSRDSRMVERKKYGHKKSRRGFQFSKR
ncbi:MAG: 30S ribosomal protein S9 [Planctomycetes bacterium]|nr:30S ribosomal protein S9 [Planctomycetota bacterium]